MFRATANLGFPLLGIQILPSTYFGPKADLPMYKALLSVRHLSHKVTV